MPIIVPNPLTSSTWDPIVDDLGVEHPVAGQVRWQASGMNHGVVQLYLDGELHNATINHRQRALWVTFDRSTSRSVHLLAVTSEDRWTDFSNLLTVPSRSLMKVLISRGLGLPWDGQLELLVDDVLLRREPIWSSGDGRAGFGGRFGTQDFGFDSAVGPGFGRPDFAFGPFGFDESALIWTLAEPTGEGDGQLRALSADGELLSTVSIDLSDWGSLSPRIDVSIDVH